MAGMMFTMLLCLSAAGMMATVRGEDPYFFFTWNVTYGTISPLGVPQQGILINGQFPGPNVNSTTNNNLVINVFNNLDEPFLLHWYIYGTATYILIICNVTLLTYYLTGIALAGAEFSTGRTLGKMGYLEPIVQSHREQTSPTIFKLRTKLAASSTIHQLPCTGQPEALVAYV